jgi:hypothetical protein
MVTRGQFRQRYLAIRRDQVGRGTPVAVTRRLTLPTLRIFHRTSYLYREPVVWGRTG